MNARFAVPALRVRVARRLVLYGITRAQKTFSAIIAFIRLNLSHLLSSWAFSVHESRHDINALSHRIFVPSSPFELQIIES